MPVRAIGPLVPSEVLASFAGVQLRYDYRPYPTPGQQQALARAFGCARVVFKVGEVEVRWSRRLPAEPSTVTVVKDAAGRSFASFVVQTTDAPLPPVEAEVGIDLGPTYFAVLSDRTKVAAPRFLRRAPRRLKRFQQDLSRKQKGSNNRKKAVVKVARAHAKVADPRRDWQHKLSTAIIRDNQAVYVEDLCVAGLGRTRLAKSVHDSGWATFTAMLEYKAARAGQAFARINRFAPTSQMCSACGRIDGTKPLAVRSWACPCGAVHDRDLNAATNILAAGRAERLDACGAQVRPAPVPAPRDEAGIHPDAACSTRGAQGIPVLEGGENVKTLPLTPGQLLTTRRRLDLTRYTLAARARGLGTAWTALHLTYEREVAALLGLPEDVHQGALIPTAYHTGEGFRPAPRVPLDQVLHVDRW